MLQKRMKIIIFLPLFLWRVVAKNCPKNLTIDVRDGFGNLNNDSKSPTYKNVTYPEGKYAWLGENIEGCVCEVQTCINLCCPLGQAMLDGFNCTDHKWEPKIDLYNKAVLVKKNANFHAINVKYKGICDSFILTPDSIKEDTYYIQYDGKLFLPYGKKKLDFENYCLSRFSNESEQEIRICETAESKNYFDETVKIISILFLLLTIMAYVLLLDTRNIHAKCQIAYVVSLLCAYFVLVYLKLAGQLTPNVCLTLGLLCLYSFMSSFFWMNISCIDIFLTFSGKKGPGLQVHSHHTKRFASYCCYAYGAPLIIVIIALINNSDDHKYKWFYPNLGVNKCWFAEGFPVLVHFYGPMGALILANIVLFILTALEIRKIREDTAMIRESENNKHHENDKQIYKLYIKLLIAMGITWSWEFISWLVDWLLEDKKISGMWIVTDLFNSLYGVFIFYLFVCKKRTWIILKKRYYSFMGQHQKANALTIESNNKINNTKRTNVNEMTSSSKV